MQLSHDTDTQMTKHAIAPSASRTAQVTRSGELTNAQVAKYGTEVGKDAGTRHRRHSTLSALAALYECMRMPAYCRYRKAGRHSCAGVYVSHACTCHLHLGLNIALPFVSVCVCMCMCRTLKTNRGMGSDRLKLLRSKAPNLTHLTCDW